jgi:hypothetical protein
MFMTHSDFKTPNEALYNEIQEVYKQYFHPETEYTCKLNYENAVNYGFIDLERRNYQKVREFNADEYISYISTHADHITLQEPYKSNFYAGIRDVILRFGNSIKLYDTIVLYMTRKP